MKDDFSSFRENTVAVVIRHYLPIVGNCYGDYFYLLLNSYAEWTIFKPMQLWDLFGSDSSFRKYTQAEILVKCLLGLLKSFVLALQALTIHSDVGFSIYEAE